MGRIRGVAAVVLAAILGGGCAATALERFPRAPNEGVPDSRTSLYVPPGAGPHPAVVMLPNCAGIGRHLDNWIYLLRRSGYAVLVVDSFGPRGVGSVCGTLAVSVDTVAADGVAAARHLRTLPFVDASRIYGVGFSYGAMALLRLSAAPQPFRAIVGFYPHCFPRPGASAHYAAAQLNFPADVAAPLHLFLGGADTESPAELCTAHADRLAGRGQPVSYTLFPGATHGFDFGSSRGGHVYDPVAVRRAEVELVEFLGRPRP